MVVPPALLGLGLSKVMLNVLLEAGVLSGAALGSTIVAVRLSESAELVLVPSTSVNVRLSCPAGNVTVAVPSDAKAISFAPVQTYLPEQFPFKVSLMIWSTVVAAEA